MLTAPTTGRRYGSSTGRSVSSDATSSGSIDPAGAAAAAVTQRSSLVLASPGSIAARVQAHLANPKSQHDGAAQITNAQRTLIHILVDLYSHFAEPPPTAGSAAAASTVLPPIQFGKIVLHAADFAAILHNRVVRATGVINDTTTHTLLLLWLLCIAAH